ncbi:MAG: heme lyase CcmF/NrfE family subunit [Actinomycetota bacterium]|nr:heme lyase CcmF/NrfE family subunit [Actinomycetota bacterium]
MNRALGLAGVIVAFSGSIIGIGVLLSGLLQRRPRQLRLGRAYALIVLIGAITAVVAMQLALARRDYTVRYVAEHGSSATPFLFNVATMWSALEGSILLWGLILAGYLAVVANKFRKRLEDPLVAWALITMFVVCVFFFGLMLTASNPFAANSPPPGFDGPGPNPLLQNHVLMAFHPPMLYLGYVGFTVPFAFAIAALVTGRVGEGWLVETRRWTLFAWGFLTAGIILGAWWSYEVLGWGGYWGWDPVENASLLPWLTGTAYLHSVMVQERRGMLRVWNLSLLCATFSLTILGTFLTRSGVVESVHAFSDGTIGPLLLGFFALIVIVSVGLIGWRGDRLRSVGRIDSPLSREGAFLANNVIFAAFAFVVLLGTVFPLIMEATRGDTLSVGPPYFNRMTMPIGLTLLLLMAVAPVLPWRKASGELLRDRLWWPAWTGLAALILAVVIGATGVAPLVAFGLGGFAAGSAIRQIALATRRQGWRGFVGRANGGMVVHLGTILVAVALAASMSFLKQGEFSLAEGETARVAGHELEFLGSRTVEYDNRVALVADVRVDGAQTYQPSLNRYRSGMTVGTPSVRTGATQDVMLSVVRAPSEENSTLGLRVMVQPMVLWLWIGGLIMVVGTALSLFPGRRRNPLDPVSAPAPIEEVEPEPGDGLAEHTVAADVAADAATSEGDDDAVGSDESVGADR